LEVLLDYPLRVPLPRLPTLTGAPGGIVLPQSRLNRYSMAVSSYDRMTRDRWTVLVVLLWLVKEGVLDAMWVKWVPSSVGDVDGQIPALERVTPFEHTWAGLNNHPYLLVRQMKPSGRHQGALLQSRNAHRSLAQEPEAQADSSTEASNTQQHWAAI